MNIPQIFSKVNSLLKKKKVEIIGGYPTDFTNSVNSICFNFLVKNDKLLSTSAGISNNEIFQIAGLSEYIKPKNILIIGNSYGISAIFLSLIFEKSNLIAIDKFRTEGINFTNSILKSLSKNKLAINASSPEDISTITKKYFNNKIDLVLIDGLHTNEAQTQDFEAVYPYLTKNSLVILHDVINCDLMNSYLKINKKYKLKSYLFCKSTSGMALLFKNKINNLKFKSYLEYFSEGTEKVIALSKILKPNKREKKLKANNKVKYILKKPQHPQK